jgi:hypothetical protein
MRILKSGVTMLKFIAVPLILSFCATGYSQGFSAGSVFTRDSLSGRLQIECTGGQVELVECNDSYLSPVDFDYFIGPKIDADEVDIIATHVNGKVIKKKSGYRDGKSTSSFNLSVNTLFQAALLDMGENKIQYVIKKHGAVLTAGVFVVKVIEGANLVCRPGYIDTFNDSLCNSPNRACDRYFAQNNYCK